MSVCVCVRLLACVLCCLIYSKIKTGQYQSSSCHAIRTDISDPLSPPLPIVHYPGRSSGLYPVSSQSCCMYVRAGRPAFARPCEGVHWSTSLMSSSLLLQQCPACLVRLTLIVFVTDGRWPYSCCFVFAAFSCNCRKFSSPYVLLASTWCIYVAVSILPLLGRNCASFYRSGLISIRPIPYRLLSMPLLIVCRCLSRLMRHCSLGRWTCQPVSVRYRLVWRCYLFDWGTYIPSCVHWHGGRCLQRLVPDYVAGFRLVRVHLPEVLCHQRSQRR